jgi:hypothetical protein
MINMRVFLSCITSIQDSTTTQQICMDDPLGHLKSC